MTREMREWTIRPVERDDEGWWVLVQVGAGDLGVAGYAPAALARKIAARLLDCADEADERNGVERPA